MRRPTVKSAAIATFIGGFAAAGIAVAAASTPDDHGTDRPAPPTSEASSTVVNTPSATESESESESESPSASDSEHRHGRHHGRHHHGRHGATSTESPTSSLPVP